MNRGIYIWLLVFSLLTGCYKEKITSISDSVQINSSYSLPIGEIKYQVNDYFEALDTITFPLPDSVSFNDTLYPNVLHVIEKTEFKQFDFANLGGNPDKIKSITIRMLIKNGFPTEAGAQVYFTDNLTITDSLFNGGIEYVPAGFIGDNGRVTEPSITLRDIVLSQQMLHNLGNYQNIRIKGEVLTTRPDMDIVKFYSDYELTIHIGIRVEMDFNINEL